LHHTSSKEQMFRVLLEHFLALSLLCVRLDESGEVVQIHYNTRFRDTFCRQSLENVEPLYRALKTFSGLIYDPQNVVEMQLKAGANFFYVTNSLA